MKTKEKIMGGIGWTELLIVFCIVLLLFGAKKIPELARSLGKAKREFHKAKDETDDDSEDVSSEKKKSAEDV